MDFRSSSSVASLAFLIATGACALMAPAIHAGERLDFSTPAFPLSVPHPEVETKEPKKIIGSGDMPGITVGLEMAPQQQIIVNRSKHRDDDMWDAKSLLGEDPDKHDFDDWLTARPEDNPLTNTSNLKMPHGWDENTSDDSFRRKNDSDFQASENGSRLGHGVGLAGENTRESERFGREPYDEKDGASWFKGLSRELSEKDRYDAARSTPFKDEPGNFDAGVRDSRTIEPAPKPIMDVAHDTPPPPPGEFDNYAPFDANQSRPLDRLMGEQSAVGPSLRAWEQPSAGGRSLSRGSFAPGQNSASRVVAPNRPINLPFPKRPGDY